MIIGITYDLREDYLAAGYSFEEIAALGKSNIIDAIDNVVFDLGFDAYRIGNVKNLVASLASGGLWDLVFNIAEGLHGFGSKAQVPCLLDAYGIPYTFSDPLVLSLTLHRGMCKRIMRDLGILTPAFVIVESEVEITKVTLPYPLFVKPIAEGTGEGIITTSKIQNQTQLKAICNNLLVHSTQPVLVETYLPGREFVVGIIGTGKEAQSLGVMEILPEDNAQCKFYTYAHKGNYENFVEYHLVHDAMAEKAKQMALTVWRYFGCRDAGTIYLRSDEKGMPNILEINPLAGLNPIRSDLPILSRLAGINYEELIGMIIQSALKRENLSQPFFPSNKPPSEKKMIH